MIIPNRLWQVLEVLSAVKPDVVVLELCSDRLPIIQATQVATKVRYAAIISRACDIIVSVSELIACVWVIIVSVWELIVNAYVQVPTMEQMLEQRAKGVDIGKQ